MMMIKKAREVDNGPLFRKKEKEKGEKRRKGEEKRERKESKRVRSRFSSMHHERQLKTVGQLAARGAQNLVPAFPGVHKATKSLPLPGANE